ncbi:MAG: GyrI-like domain-containing protein [Pseudomonadota bacterium]
MTIERKTLSEQHYLFVERESSMSGPEIADAMGSGFGEVFGFNAQKGIAPISMPMAIYMEMPSGDKMAFRVGVFVSPEDAAKAEGNIKSATMPAGDALMMTHVGPYATLNVSHKALWDHMTNEGLPQAMPVWEIYVDDPTTVSEDKLRTEIYRAIGS